MKNKYARIYRMQTFTTPMMKQYMEIKKNYEDCLLFYRMGDFYELFMEDAYIGAKVLNITLTGRPKGKDGRIPMAGVPFHAVDTYLAKLVKAGYKVAICEQLSPPNKRGIIERDVIRVVTPGTMLDDKALEKKENNFLVSILLDKGMIALSIVDVSTGYFTTTEFMLDESKQLLKDEISRIQPTECILPFELYDDQELLGILRTERGLNIFCFQNWHNYAGNAREVLKKHFGVSTLASFGIDPYELSLKSSAALLGYLKETQKDNLSHLKKICFQTSQDAVILDRSTIINLELFTTIREHDTKGSLLSIIDHTDTPMGGRLLKQWLRSPLTNREEILSRHDSVEEVLQKTEERTQVKNLLSQVPDIERTLSRLSVKIGNARDLTNLKQAIETILEVKKVVTPFTTTLLKTSKKLISPQLTDITKLIAETVVDEPPIDLRNGGIIRDGVNSELDKLRNHISHSQEWVLELEKKERERTGITSLKVRFNKVFGFYIEVSKANLANVPENYMRKQTLVNGERFITPELKEHEEIILTAEEKINELEFTLFTEILAKVLSYTEVIQQAAECIAVIDCITNFATIAEKNNYTRPKLIYSGEIKITNGRHPVVEKLLSEDKQFVPNDVDLDNTNHQLLLITGPNMAGKSVYIRQVALLLLLSQIGSFIPAENAQLSIVDRIFVRSGASDVITSGLSTFMVEMVETAHILHHATKNSLIVMDEIGRGTSTYDGISIAWAVAEYLVTAIKPSPKTLFATHYHELQELEEQYPKRIKNFHMAVQESNGQPVFLHTILPGGASHSFGVAVARLAGVPEEVIKKANEILHNLENRNVENDHTYSSSTAERSREALDDLKPTPDLADHFIHKELENLDIHQLTPLEALNKLAELKQKMKLFQENSHTHKTAD